jgi:hypothetical protein
MYDLESKAVAKDGPTCFEGERVTPIPGRRPMRPVRRVHPFFYLLVVLTFTLSPQCLTSQAQSSPQPSTNSASTSQNKPNPSKVDCTNNGSYTNGQGQTAPRPEHCSGPPKGATAQCRDGAYSFSQSRRGTCSHHGGVTRWL